VSVQATSSRLLAGFGIVGIGLVAALAIDMALSSLSPAKVAFILGGCALLIPMMVLEDPKAYGLFLLVLSIPFDISKWLSDPEVTQNIVDTYGNPMSGTSSLEIYLTDVVLVAMLLPWLARVCLRRETLYFPKIGYLFVFYLAWALLVSLINATSLFLSMVELCRQTLYFLSFVYLINNVSTPLQFRSVVWAVFLGLIIGAGTVIVFFERGIGTDTVAFASLHDESAAVGPAQTHKNKKESAPEDLTVSVNPDGGRNLGSMGRETGSEIKRSQGMFRHPAIAAGLCVLTLPIVLGYIIGARSSGSRILFFLVYAWGLVALLLTFSRAGLVGLIVGIPVFFAVAAWSGLISRGVLRFFAIALAVILVISIPVMTIYFNTRPGATTMRLVMFEAAIQAYSEHPVLGVGLNNSSAAMKTSRQETRDLGIQIPATEPADSYYLAVLMEVGPVGSILFFVFFGKIVMMALRSVREAPAEVKPLLVGMVAGLAAVATQSIADGPLAGHAVSGILWLFAALIVVIARNTQAEIPWSWASRRTKPERRSFATSRLVYSR
jgi:O-Antigen ligase